MIGLVAFVDEHRAEVEYDLIGLGLRLRDWPSERLSWRDLFVVVSQAPPTSACYRAVAGDDWQRSLTVDLLRQVEHTTRVLAWQNSDGKGEYPPLIPLPWDEPDHDRPDAMSLDEVFEWLGWEKPKELTA